MPEPSTPQAPEAHAELELHGLPAIRRVIAPVVEEPFVEPEQATVSNARESKLGKPRSRERRSRPENCPPDRSRIIHGPRRAKEDGSPVLLLPSDSRPSLSISMNRVDSVRLSAIALPRDPLGGLPMYPLSKFLVRPMP